MANNTQQKGAAMVELALTLPLMLLILMGIIEFSLLLFMWSKGVEASRAGVRFASVSTPVVSLSALNCTGGNSTNKITANCGSANCTALLQEMQRVMPELTPNNVNIIYECSRTGNPDRPIEMKTPEIRVSIQNMSYSFISPKIIGLGLKIDMPEFSSTHTAEDLHSL